MKIIELQDKYYDSLKRFINFHVRNRWIAEDIVQETFLKAHENYDSLRDKEKSKPWIYKIAWNLCIDFFKRNDKETDNTTENVLFKDIHTIIEIEEMGKCINSKIHKLPEKLKNVISLYQIEEMSHKEISEILDISEDTSKKRLQRAREKMKVILERECVFERDKRDVFICIPKEDVYDQKLQS